MSAFFFDAPGTGQSAGIPRGPNARDMFTRPTLIQGDAAWCALTNLSKADAITYLNDRKARRFNALLVSATEAYFSPTSPGLSMTRDGLAPYTVTNDFGTPNPAYFDHVAWFVERCAERGIVLFLCPHYSGFEAGVEGWYQRFAANGVAKIESSCAYLAARLQAYDNVIWAIGGDYTPPVTTYYEAMHTGIRRVESHKPATLHLSPGDSSSELAVSFTPAINLGYEYAPNVPTHMHGIYGVAGSTMLVESRYENEQSVSAQTIRSGMYYSVLCGGVCGHIYGCAPMWYFGVPGDGNPGHAFATNNTQPWTAWLASQGAQDMTRWGDFFRARRWHELQPDTGNTLVTAGKGSGATYVAAARTADGFLAVAYLPTTGAITVNTSLLACNGGTSMTARWVDPSTGATTSIGTYTTGGSRVFTPSGNNGTGSPDWVLVIEAT